VNADVTSTQRFVDFADGLRAKGLSDRTFGNECHTFILEVGYRRALGSFERVCIGMVVLVVFLATMLLPRMERCRQSMLVTDASIIRARAMKRKIRYKVVRVEQRSEM
jgi:hypothetical protein